MSNQRRDFLKSLLVAGAGLGCGLLSLRATGHAMGQRPLPRGIVFIKGPSATVNGQAARVGQELTAGDVLATAPNTSVAFVIGFNAFLLRGGSRLTLPREENLQEGAFRFKVIRLDAGGLLSVFERNHPKEVQTVTAVAGIRGTGLYCEVRPDHDYFCTCYGEVALQPRGQSQGEILKARHHEVPRKVYARSGDGTPAIVPAGMDNHTDEELIMLEGLVGRVPLFGATALPYQP